MKNNKESNKIIEFVWKLAKITSSRMLDTFMNGTMVF